MTRRRDLDADPAPAPAAAVRPGEDGPRATLGVVVIGRNEGERLRRCLGSLVGRAPTVVYVDSGSTDGSVEAARALGAVVVALDLSTPFTAARARNAGFRRLAELEPGVALVQFVDGDVEVEPGWIEAASRFLDEHEDVVAVCGRLRERSPEATVYQRLCDLEWDRGSGEVDAVGGIAMYRADAFRAVDGFDPSVIAGEEGELCLRLRRRGGRIWALPAPMGWHDAAISRFGQWWRRAERCGHAYAEGAAIHGRDPSRHHVRDVLSTLFWGLAVPLGIAATAALAVVWPPAWAAVALGLASYPLLAFKVYRHAARRFPARHAAFYAAFCVLAKFPESLGVVRYWRNRLLGRRSTIIEYKGPRAGG